MPTYDYVCQGCGHEFEHFQSMGSRRLRKCPRCEERKLIRLVGSGAGVIFKGSGFYETDYKRSGPRPAESDSSSASKTGASESDGQKSDAKKTESKPGGSAGKSGDSSGSDD